jgi:hypothetical protein
MKAVGMLLSELHSEYHGTREIAMAQLILLGDKMYVGTKGSSK